MEKFGLLKWRIWTRNSLLGLTNWGWLALREERKLLLHEMGAPLGELGAERYPGLRWSGWSGLLHLLVWLYELRLACYALIDGIHQRASYSRKRSVPLLPLIWLTEVDHVLQGTPGEYFTFHLDFFECLYDVLLGVLVGDGELGIVKPSPPNVFKIRPHALDRIELWRCGWNEQQFDS